MRWKTIIAGLVVSLAGWTVKAQEPVSDFEIRTIVTEGFNEVRKENNLDTLLSLDVLDNVAREMVQIHMETKRSVRDKEKIADMLEEYGGYGGAKWRVFNGRASVKKGKRILTIDDVKKELYAKFIKKKRNVKNLKDPDYVYMGVAVGIDEKGKGYIYVLVADKDVDNRGADKSLRKQLPIRYTKGRKGIVPYEKSACKDLKKFQFDGYYKLSKGLSIRDNGVYLEYDDLTELTPLLNAPKDGFAVELVLKSQYPCEGANIFDRARQYRGFVFRPRYSKKILSANEGINNLNVKIGKVPGRVLKKLDLAGEYELNLIIVQNKTFCKRIVPGFQEEVSFEVPMDLILYPDTFYREGDKRFKPTKEKHVIEFKIKFEKGKYEYKLEDVAPILDTLDVPEFTIDSIFIEAHSSIEGDSAINAELQIKRGQTIAQAILEKYKALSKKVRVVYDDSWELFREQIKKDPDYGWLADTTKAYVRERLAKDPVLLKKLEPLLQEQRFARIVLYVTVDIKGGAELRYFQRKMDQALQKKDVRLALGIQRYLISQVVNGRYSPDVVLNLKLPTDPAFAQLHLNRIWMEYKYIDSGIVKEKHCQELKKWERFLARNEIYQYNTIVCKLKFEEPTEEEIEQIQENIKALRSSPIKSDDLDRMDLYFNIMILDRLVEEYEPGDPALTERLNYIKQLFKPEQYDWNWNGKIALLALQSGDPQYSISLLEGGLQRNIPAGEDFYKFYAYLVSWDDDKIATMEYRRALYGWYEKDPVEVCDKMGKTGEGPTFQATDDPYIKILNCKKCK